MPYDFSFPFLNGQPSFVRMIRPIEKAPICLSLEKVALCAANEVLVEVDDNILLIVGNSWRILDQQLRPKPIYVLNVISILINLM